MSVELANVSQAARVLALVETPEEAKDLYDKLEALSQYARRYRVDHDKQNEIAEAKLRTARKGGTLLGETIQRGGPTSRGATLPADFTRSMSSRWQALAAIPDAKFEEHLAAVTASDEELTLAGALRFQRLGRAARADERTRRRRGMLMATATATRRYPCARCGKQDRPERMLFSQHTRLRYCIDIDACTRRARRKGH